VAAVQRYEHELYSFLEAKHATMLSGLASKRELTDDLKAALDRALADFAKLFRA
jgi:F-type H+-transporting ATPase subunit alpha